MQALLAAMLLRWGVAPTGPASLSSATLRYDLNMLAPAPPLHALSAALQPQSHLCRCAQHHHACRSHSHGCPLATAQPFLQAESNGSLHAGRKRKRYVSPAGWMCPGMHREHMKLLVLAARQLPSSLS